VELPSGYNNAWYNGSTNEYIVTDSQLYNPSVEASGNWTKLEKRKQAAVPITSRLCTNPRSRRAVPAGSLGG